ncbi:MAG: 7TM-DISM domain-containing protein, partial [Ferruginibacter sp.]
MQPGLRRTLVLIILINYFIPCAYSQEKTPVFYLYEDSAKALTPASALKFFREGAFNQTGKEAYNAGFTRSVFWLAYMNEAERQPDSLLLY